VQTRYTPDWIVENRIGAMDKVYRLKNRTKDKKLKSGITNVIKSQIKQKEREGNKCSVVRLRGKVVICRTERQRNIITRTECQGKNVTEEGDEKNGRLSKPEIGGRGWHTVNRREVGQEEKCVSSRGEVVNGTKNVSKAEGE